MASGPPRAGIEVGHVLSRGFEALSANFPSFFGIALLLVGLPAFFGQYFLLAGIGQSDPLVTLSADGARTSDSPFVLLAGHWPPILASLVLALFCYALLQVVLARSTILHLSGRAPDMAGSAMLALRLLLPTIGLTICVTILLAIGFLCLVFPAIMIWCALIVAVPALVEERGGVFASMARSRRLTRGSRWRIFLLVVLIWIFSWIVSAVAGAIGGATHAFTRAVTPDPVLPALADGLGSTLTGLITTITIAALYVELREAREGTSANQVADIFA